MRENVLVIATPWSFSSGQLPSYLTQKNSPRAYPKNVRQSKPQMANTPLMGSQVVRG